MADEPATIPADQRPRAWAFLVGLLVFRLLNSLYWALVGGLGWGFGTAVGSMVPLPGAATIGGAVGLALVMLGDLTLDLGKRSGYTPIQLAAFGGAAAGSASLSLLNPLSPDVNLVLGAGVGFFVGLLSSVMKQHFAPVSVVPAGTIAFTGTALFAGVGSSLGGAPGWAAASAISLFWMAIVAECLRREPAVLIDANEKPARVIPRREMCWQAARQGWSLSFPLVWGWNGLCGGLLASLWAVWAADHPNVDAMRKPFLACGGLATVVIIVTRLGILKPRRQSQPTSG